VRILFKGFGMVTQMEQQGHYFNNLLALFLQYIFKMKAILYPFKNITAVLSLLCYIRHVYLLLL